MFSRYLLVNEDVIHDRNLLYIVVKVTLMTDPIEVIHYVNFVMNGIWTVMSYSGIYDVTIFSVIFVMQMAFISIIGNSSEYVHKSEVGTLLPKDIYKVYFSMIANLQLC
jgi:hypothetical protein